MKKYLVFICLIYLLIGCSGSNSTKVSLNNLSSAEGVHHSQVEKIGFTYYIPKNLSEKTGLLLMLHPGQVNNTDFMYSTKMNEYADLYDFVAVYPLQSITYNKELYWNWFLEENQNGIGIEIKSLTTIVKTLITHLNVDKSKVFVGGFSAGGCQAINLGVTYPDIFSGMACASGIGYGLVDNVIDARNLMENGENVNQFDVQEICKNFQEVENINLLLFHGLDDVVVNFKNSQLTINQFVEASDYLDDGTNNSSLIESIDSLTTDSYRDYNIHKYVDCNQNQVITSYEFDQTGHVYGGDTDYWFIDQNLPLYSEIIVKHFFK